MRHLLASVLLSAGISLVAGEGSTVLSVTATDDGLPSATLSYQWSMLSGPSGATVSMTAATAATTTVTMYRVGTYRFQVAISDGALTTTGAVSVEAVSSGGSTPPTGGGGGGGGGGCGLGSIAGALGIGALLLGLRRRR